LQVKLSAVLFAVAALAAGCGGSPSAAPSPASTPPSATARPPAPAAAGPVLPVPNATIPRAPGRLAHRLLVTTRALHASVDRWREEGDPATGGPPRDVQLLALHHQRIYRVLRSDEGLAKRTFGKLPSGLAREARAIVGSSKGLKRITPALQARKIRTKKPVPVGQLLGYYRQAEKRFGVPWEVLASVNFVESAFGKIRTDSAVGAQGPMQFMPATWAAYGLGGDVHDERDAIMGAANYLAASGALGDVRKALWHYNHSTDYVDAVIRYARQIEADADDLYVFYSWQLFVRTEKGDLRLTGPGR
jgi:soluble lytic murein transglycosylase-like protein